MYKKSIALFLAVALIAAPVQADIFSSITSGISNAINTVGNGIGSATNAVGNGLNTALNATSTGLNSAANATGRWVSTAVGGVRDAYNTSSSAIRNWTSDVRDTLSPAAESVRDSANSLGNTITSVASGTYQGALGVGRNITGNSPSPPSSNQTSSTDTTSPVSILNTLLANDTAYIQVANSLLVALGQNQTAGVQSAIKNIVNNSTGNATYPSQAVNSTISLRLAQAIVTSIITANNYTVTVNYQGRENRVNATQVGNVFIAGLQDGLTPCARNVSSAVNATAGSSQYFETVAARCCFLVSQPLTYTEALSQTNGVATQFESSLASSQSLGQAPSLDLARCLTNTTSVS